MTETIIDWCKGLPWETVSFSEWIQIIITIFTFGITTYLTIRIFRLQSKHEREMNSLEQKRYEDNLANLADRFLIDNEAEINYLPWCVLASSLHRHDRHKRKIYTSFCRCSNELQNKILEVANYDFRIITDPSWADRAFEDLRIDIENHDLGKNILYDNAKYFHRSFRNYKDLEWKDLDFKSIFEPIIPDLGPDSFFKKQYDCLADYLVEYLCFRYKEKMPVLYNGNPIKPIDYLCQLINFGAAPEPFICAWTMEMVKEISLVIHNCPYTERKTAATELDYTDAKAETYEDHYYEALQALYNTYYTEKPTE